MEIKNLNPGVTVHLREDLEVGQIYDKITFVKSMNLSKVTVKTLVENSHIFRVKENNFLYSFEMIDWEKTVALKNFVSELNKPADIRDKTMRKVVYNKYIPVKFDGGKQIFGTGKWEEEYPNRGYFHQWSVTWEEVGTGVGQHAVAVVENLDGTVEMVYPHQLKFVLENEGGEG